MEVRTIKIMPIGGVPGRPVYRITIPIDVIRDWGIPEEAELLIVKSDEQDGPVMAVTPKHKEGK